MILPEEDLTAAIPRRQIASLDAALKYFHHRLLGNNPTGEAKMKKTLMLFLGVIGVSVLASWQTVVTPTVLADQIVRPGTAAVVTQLRGNVQITSGNSQLMADEADMRVQPDGTTLFELRGTVRFSIKR
jgi:hypothetical protein